MDTATIPHHLTYAELIHNRQQYQGLIPIDIQFQKEPLVTWLDVGHHHFTQAKFRYSIAKIVDEQKHVKNFTTDIDVLSSPDIVTDCLYPSGFIFQMSRCGSTLLGKVLSRLSSHFVLHEGPMLNDGLWSYFTQRWSQHPESSHENLTILKHLVLAIGRKRKAEQTTYFVKFRSFNVLFIDFISQAFPDVPIIFLYRNPNEVVISALQRTPPYIRFKGLPPSAFMLNRTVEESEMMSNLEYFVELYVQYLESALGARAENIVYLNYNQLNKQNLASILEDGFGYVPIQDDIFKMQEQFNYYSKDDSNATRFVSDSRQKQQAVTPAIQQAVTHQLIPLYEQLEDSARNLARLRQIAKDAEYRIVPR